LRIESTDLKLSRNGLVGSKRMFPVRLGIVGQLCVPFVCRSSSRSMGDGDRTNRLTVGQESIEDTVCFGSNLCANRRLIVGPLARRSFAFGQSGQLVASGALLIGAVAPAPDILFHFQNKSH